MSRTASATTHGQGMMENLLPSKQVNKREALAHHGDSRSIRKQKQALLISFWYNFKQQNIVNLHVGDVGEIEIVLKLINEKIDSLKTSHHSWKTQKRMNAFIQSLSLGKARIQWIRDQIIKNIKLKRTKESYKGNKLFQNGFLKENTNLLTQQSTHGDEIKDQNSHKNIQSSHSSFKTFDDNKAKRKSTSNEIFAFTHLDNYKGRIPKKEEPLFSQKKIFESSRNSLYLLNGNKPRILNSKSLFAEENYLQKSQQSLSICKKMLEGKKKNKRTWDMKQSFSIKYKYIANKGKIKKIQFDLKADDLSRTSDQTKKYQYLKKKTKTENHALTHIEESEPSIKKGETRVIEAELPLADLQKVENQAKNQQADQIKVQDESILSEQNMEQNNLDHQKIASSITPSSNSSKISEKSLIENDELNQILNRFMRKKEQEDEEKQNEILGKKRIAHEAKKFKGRYPRKKLTRKRSENIPLKLGEKKNQKPSFFSSKTFQNKQNEQKKPFESKNEKTKLLIGAKQSGKKESSRCFVRRKIQEKVEIGEEFKIQKVEKEGTENEKRVLRQREKDFVRNGKRDEEIEQNLMSLRKEFSHFYETRINVANKNSICSALWKKQVGQLEEFSFGEVGEELIQVRNLNNYVEAGVSHQNNSGNYKIFEEDSFKIDFMKKFCRQMLKVGQKNMEEVVKVQEMFD